MSLYYLVKEVDLLDLADDSVNDLELEDCEYYDEDDVKNEMTPDADLMAPAPKSQDIVRKNIKQLIHHSIPRGKISTKVRITQNKGKESENSYQKIE